MLSVPNKPIRLSVIMLNVIIMSVVVLNVKAYLKCEFFQLFSLFILDVSKCILLTP